ncbi:hypothetical protein KSF_109200 [Reticulibacter mediterranei]|uniref:Uncharacterized protein n=1 Tax=Reticulibacter mediterranei TaxID=2778369 RepID=A0A8J3J1Y9_9CHLR|nr:hypothetical protein KSF_109200 [Reticulibacter mediterranei]
MKSMPTFTEQDLRDETDESRGNGHLLSSRGHMLLAAKRSIAINRVHHLVDVASITIWQDPRFVIAVTSQQRYGALSPRL